MIKKLNIVFIVLVSFLIFYVQFNEFNESYAMGVYGPTAVHVKNNENTNEMILTIDLSSMDVSQSNETYLFSLISNINRPASLHFEYNPIEEGYLTYVNYIYGSTDIIKDATVTTESYDNATNYYISNDVSDPNNTHLIEYLDDKYYDLKSAYEIKTVILSMENIVDTTVLVNDKVNVTFIVNDSDKGAFVKDVSEVLNIPITHDDFFTTSHTDLNVGEDIPWYISAFKQPRPILYISSVSLLIILLLDAKKNNKEITVRRLHGNKSNTIFKVLFLRTILLNVSVLFLTLGLAYLYFIGKFSALSYRFIQYITPSIVLFTILLIVFMMVFYLILRFNGTIISLKKSQQHTASFYASLFVKAVCVLILALPLISSIDVFVNAKRAFDNIKNDQIAQESLSINFLTYNESNLSERNRKVFGIINEYKLGIRDMLKYSEIKMNEEFMKESESDSSYSGYTEGYNPHIPFIVMNQHSITDYTFIDEENNPIEISQYKDKNWILAPTKFRNEIVENGIKCFGECEIVYYQNKVIIDDLGSSLGRNTSNSKLIYVMNQYTDEVIFEFGITSKLENQKMTEETKEALELLQQEFPSNKPSIHYGPDLYTLAEATYSEALISMSIQIVLTVFLISVFVYTYLSIYFDFKGKELVIKYLNGTSFEKRYLQIFCTMIVSNMLTVICMLWLKHQNTTATNQFVGWLDLSTILQYTFFALILESTILVLTIMLFQQKKTNLILKGEGE